MLEYIEKRGFIRMEINCAAKIEFQGIEPVEAVVKDLSATGMQIWVNSPIPEGCVGTVRIEPDNNLTPPLQADIEIIRCEALADQPNTYAAACTIKQMLNDKTNAA